jgi:hypothetical protein
MGKKFGYNERKEEAKVKEIEKKLTTKLMARKAEEDAYWHDEGDKNM